ncbi:MAG: DUF3094 family protein [Porticoccaceae bacterium]|jgi:hypothetical protein|nr:DUF3094 family protein [Gammaproteobacteria bacterium]TAL07191.1 MAG: DUF3094 family protein [Porticoccaceae bacterium]
MIEKPKLSEEDLARVREYLNSPIHQVERQPFRPLRLLLVLWIVVSLISGFALLFAWMMGAL